MKIYTKRLVFDEKIKKTESLLDAVEDFLRKSLPGNSDVLRYAIVEVEGDQKTIEVALIEDSDEIQKGDLRRTTIVPGIDDGGKKFVVANIVPTGVRAEIGGWIGDATPATNVLAEISDYVITHPNVLNAAFLNYGRDNVLYTEGYHLDQFFSKRTALRELMTSKRHNRIGVILDRGAIEADKESINIAINTIESLRAVGGIEVTDYVITDDAVGGRAVRMKSGAFCGEVKNPGAFLKPAEELIKKGAQAIAIATYISISMDDLDAYFRGEIPNPYGGTEALISHTISRAFKIPAAHGPILSKEEKERMTAKGLVDPRAASEVVSPGYLGSVLRGLHQSPRPVDPSFLAPNDITLNDVNAIIVPHTCCGGIPVLAAQKNNIIVIAVKENRTVLNVTPEKLGLNNVIVAENFLEAFGIISTIKAGVSLDSVRRPIHRIKEKIFD
jgi:hypothetical protein